MAYVAGTVSAALLVVIWWTMEDRRRTWIPALVFTGVTLLAGGVELLLGDAAIAALAHTLAGVRS